MLLNFLDSPADGIIFYEIVPSFPYGDVKQMLEKHISEVPAYTFNIMGRISEISQGTTARELIEALKLIGDNVVVDAEGHSVDLDTVLTKDMQLCLNGTYFYKFGFQN